MPNYNPDEQPAKLSSFIKPKRLKYGPEDLQFGDLYVPNQPGSHPVVILIHGGYWRARYGLDLMNDLAEDLAKRGYAAWNIEYRRVGNPGGGWPGTFQDVALAADYIRKLAPSYTLDLQRLYLSDIPRVVTWHSGLLPVHVFPFSLTTAHSLAHNYLAKTKKPLLRLP